MTKQEEQFQKEILANCEMARQTCGTNPARFLMQVESYGALKAVQELIRRRRVSDGFDRLQTAGRLDLSVEASVIRKEYAALFSDEEVNYCLDVLLECGYFGYR